MASTVGYHQVRSSAHQGLESTDAVYMVGLLMTVGVAIQMVLCAMFAYKGCKAKFWPDPPPYTPSSTNFNLQQQSQEPVGPPPVYVTVENEETSHRNTDDQSTERDPGLTTEPSSTFVSMIETHDATYSEHPRGTGATQDVAAANEGQEEINATISTAEDREVDLNRTTRHVTQNGERDSSGSSSQGVAFEDTNNERLSIGTGEMLNEERSQTNSGISTVEDQQVDKAGTITTLDEEHPSSGSSFEGVAFEDTNNERLSIGTGEMLDEERSPTNPGISTLEDEEVDEAGTTLDELEHPSYSGFSSQEVSLENINSANRLSMNVRENMVTWTATQQGLEYEQTRVPHQELTLEVHKNDSLNEKRNDIETVTVCRHDSDSAVA